MKACTFQNRSDVFCMFFFFKRPFPSKFCIGSFDVLEFLGPFFPRNPYIILPLNIYEIKNYHKTFVRVRDCHFLESWQHWLWKRDKLREVRSRVSHNTRYIEKVMVLNSKMKDNHIIRHFIEHFNFLNIYLEVPTLTFLKNFYGTLYPYISFSIFFVDSENFLCFLVFTLSIQVYRKTF